MSELLILLSLGAIAGVIAGLLGLGGGAVIVPALFFLFTAWQFPPEIIMHLAVGTSLMTIIFTAIASVHAHHRHGSVQWLVFKRMTIGIILGALFGALIADQLPSDALRIIFGLFEMFIGVQMLFGLRPKPGRTLPQPGGLNAAGFGIGTISSIMGIGGGTLTVPFLTWCNVSIRQAVATSAACGLPIAVAGAIGFLISGLDQPLVPEWSTGYIYWPAVAGIVIASSLTARFGAWLAHVLPVDSLKKLFGVVVFLVGLRILI